MNLEGNRRIERHFLTSMWVGKGQEKCMQEKRIALLASTVEAVSHDCTVKPQRMGGVYSQLMCSTRDWLELNA